MTFILILVPTKYMDFLYRNFGNLFISTAFAIFYYKEKYSNDK